MRKRTIALFLAIALLGGVFTVAATGGMAGDPLISKSYADGVYLTSALKSADEQIAKRHDALYAAAGQRLQARYDHYATRAEVMAGKGRYDAAFAGARYKKGDVVKVTAGSGLYLLAGTAEISGTAVNLTQGQTQTDGVLAARDRYLAADDSTVLVTITSPTAVLSLEGFSGVTLSGETDYNALAGAMKAMGLFRGSDTGYGYGYDLEQPPTRIQGLIMFLRLLGEEQAALATTASHPFTDVPAWCASYVAYAYEKGYTKGVDSVNMRFGTAEALTAQDYTTFLLRALGYRDTGDGADFAWNNSLKRALELGVITAGEHKLLTEGAFLRAHVVYLSYYALDGRYKGSADTLLKRLTASGAVDSATVKSARGAVTVKRLS